MGIAPEIMNTLFTGGMMQNQVGMQRTDRNQAVKLDEIQQFNAPREARLRSILETQGLLTPMAGLSQTGTSNATSNATSYMDSLTKGSSESKGGGPSAFQSLLGAGMTFIGAGGLDLFGGGQTTGTTTSSSGPSTRGGRRG
jgi:hypothetical protein